MKSTHLDLLQVAIGRGWLPLKEKGSPKIDDASNIADDRKAPSK